MSQTSEHSSDGAKAPQTRSTRNLKAYHEEELVSGFSDGGLGADIWPYLKPQRFWLVVGISIALQSGSGVPEPGKRENTTTVFEEGGGDLGSQGGL